MPFGFSKSSATTATSPLAGSIRYTWQAPISLSARSPSYSQSMP
jgi:hypothetical protein